MGNVQDARREMTKTKEQLEEEKKISLSIRIKPLDLDAMDGEQLNNKATELWDTIVRLETEKYDLEERQKRQDYDVSSKYLLIITYNYQKSTICYWLRVSIIMYLIISKMKELKERQRQQNKQKAIKLGLDPE